jgi:hypothetical protein
VGTSVSRTEIPVVSRDYPSGWRSVFDIVYPITANGIPTAARTRTSPEIAPVNFLYMGLFLGFKKTQVAMPDLCVTS